MDNFSLPQSVIDEVNTMANKMCSGLIIDAAKAMPPEEMRKTIVAAALHEVKFSSGSKHRAALRELDKVVRRYFPLSKVRRALLLNWPTSATCSPDWFLMLLRITYLISRCYENPQYKHTKRR